MCLIPRILLLQLITRCLISRPQYVVLISRYFSIITAYSFLSQLIALPFMLPVIMFIKSLYYCIIAVFFVSLPLTQCHRHICISLKKLESYVQDDTLEQKVYISLIYCSSFMLYSKLKSKFCHSDILLMFEIIFRIVITVNIF